MRPPYRSDIDGLRGLAVLSVIGYHTLPARFGGGFVGVDVFFVISGFLITGILLGRLKNSRFSFAEFYKGRCRRIFPALAIVTAACLLYGWFGLLPDDYKQLGQHAAGAATFSSNFLLWNEAGYFNNAAETKPFLHLWSLGIEEQFYLAWPALLWLGWKSRVNLPAVCLLILAASFAVNIATVNHDAVAAFYSPLSRGWELMAGALLAFLAFRQPPIFEAFGSANTKGLGRMRHAAAGLGATLIALAIMTTSRNSAFPGWLACLPVLGTCLIIAAGPAAWLNRRLFSHRLLVWVGLISYPLYLWHWPLLTFARLRQPEPLTIAAAFGCVVLSCVLAWLTYKYLERPIRFGPQGRLVIAALCAAITAIGSLGYYISLRHGFPSRLGDKEEFVSFFSNTPPEYRYATAHHLFEAYREQCDFYDNRNQKPRTAIARECFIPASGNVMLIWGDSHAQHLFYGLRKTLPESISILQVATSDCRPSIIDVFPNRLSVCNESNRFALDLIAKVKPHTVLLAQGGGHDSTDFEAIARRLKNLGVGHVLLAGPVPIWNRELYKIIANDFWLATPRRSRRSLAENNLQIDQALKKKYSGNTVLTYISIIDCFCDDTGCLLYLGNNRRDRIVTHDSAHLSPAASEFLSQHLLGRIVAQTFQDQ